ncbi:hypothetical protein EUTSA_v10006428mg, partial [Eutrema salsugineum]
MMPRRKTRSFLAKIEPIPFDLVIEILLRLPVKSIATFRRVSKLWASTLRDPSFTESYLTISSSRKKLLFTCLKDDETCFFSSSPNSQSPSSDISAKVHMSFPINCPTNICRPVRGLVCGLNQRRPSKGRTVTVPLICNPSTGQSLALPDVRTRGKRVISCFGYDPIDKQFKVFSQDHQVLTLGTQKKPSWKMIKCEVPHIPVDFEHTNGGVCINGVLYYLAILLHVDAYTDGYFDIGEKLESTLVNYKGKLAKLQRNIDDYGTYTGIQLWVLEDAEKHEWSSYIYVLPPPWKNIFEETTLCFVGTTSKGEIVLSPNTISDSFYLLYHNPETKTITKVGVQGMEAYKGHKAYTFLDHVEDVTLVS